MSEKDLEYIKEISREELESVVGNIWDGMNYYKKDNKRLKESVHNMYIEVRRLCMELAFETDMSKENKDIMKKIFKKYLS